MKRRQQAQPQQALRSIARKAESCYLAPVGIRFETLIASPRGFDLV
jgi:hypothetical protein